MKKATMLVAVATLTLIIGGTNVFAEESGTWQGNGRGEPHYFKEDGNMAVSEIVCIDGKYYVFNTNGIICHDKWVTTVSGRQYHCNSNGIIDMRKDETSNELFLIDDTGKTFATYPLHPDSEPKISSAICRTKEGNRVIECEVETHNYTKKHSKESITQNLYLDGYRIFYKKDSENLEVWCRGTLYDRVEVVYGEDTITITTYKEVKVEE